MTIADLDEMEVTVEVNENDIIRVGFNDTCDIEVDAYLGKTFKGIVTNIANSAMSSGMGTDQITNFEVNVRVLRNSYATLVNEKQPDQSPFRPGMSATVDIRTREVKNVLTVPIQAVTTRSKKELQEQSEEKTESDEEEEAIDKVDGVIELIFVVIDGKSVAKVVKTGIQDNEFIQLLSGAELGDKVITAPYRSISKKLKPGDEVEIVSKKDLYSSKEGPSD
jgi:HlyD family secretion protein